MQPPPINAPPSLQLNLGEVYCGEAAVGRTYRLRSAVGYCGAHYLAFVLLPEMDGQ
jgi:hypothetical protein